ncbi:hypothetical protein ACFC0M_07030 [Streptomyces sp. NPDC056149]|uniref:hypothetical protein n=1 Tax=Streptomyces sp. NPDC056149 TaxID=3345728 RepID=UPI0035DCE982
MSVLSNAAAVAAPGIAALLTGAPTWIVWTASALSLVILALPLVDRMMIWLAGKPSRDRQKLINYTLTLITDPERRLELMQLFERDTDASAVQPRLPDQSDTPPGTSAG